MGIQMRKKIVIACDKYKGNLSALEVCNIIKEAIIETGKDVEIVVNPIADGGEGTVDTLIESYRGMKIQIPVTDPLGNEINAKFGIIDGTTAIIEMSSASGLYLVPEFQRNPMNTTTFGTGELISAAIQMGCSKIIIGIGGSATNDAGMGMAQALGVKFYDKNGEIISGYGGRQLIKLDRIDISGLDPAIKDISFFAACDVDSPLYGPRGAAFVYGPQKGADDIMVKELDAGLENFAEVVQRDLCIDVSELKGGGAAGGLGAGLFIFLNAQLKRGVELIIEATKLEEKIKGADLIVTGEGVMDNQTFYGKSAYGVAALAEKYNIPVITINGSVNIDYTLVDKSKRNLFAGNFSTTTKPMPLEDAIKNGASLLKAQAGELIRFFLSCSKP
jgi:glycerate kinase